MPYDGYNPQPSDLTGRSDDALSILYRELSNLSSYTHVEGRLVLPVAATQNADGTWAGPEIVRLHAPFGLRTVQFAAHKMNKPPVIPRPISPKDETALDNDVYLSGSVNVPMPRLAPDGQAFHYAAGGSYQYVQRSTCRPGQVDLLSVDFPFFLGGEDLPQPYTGSFDSSNTPWSKITDPVTLYDGLRQDYFSTTYSCLYMDPNLIADSNPAPKPPSV